MPKNQVDMFGKDFFTDIKILTISDINANGINGVLRGKWNTFLYINSGKSVLQIDFDEFSAVGNKIFFIEKYKIWNWIKTEGLKGIMVQFTDSFYNYIYTGNPKLKSDQTLIGEIPPFTMVTQANRAEWNSLFEVLEREYGKSKNNSKEILCLILKVLILLYRRSAQTRSRSFESRQKKQLVLEFRKLVNSRYETLRSARDYAHVLNITPNYLNALSQEFFLKSVSEIITERMILEAKRLLMHSRLSVSEIGYKLGFKDNSYFGRYFKKAAGVTPKAFRNSCFIKEPGELKNNDQ
jgi:AraC family transcriptional activator of pobA